MPEWYLADGESLLHLTLVTQPRLSSCFAAIWEFSWSDHIKYVSPDMLSVCVCPETLEWQPELALSFSRKHAGEERRQGVCGSCPRAPEKEWALGSGWR